MDALVQHFALHGPFLRRRDLLAAGFADDHIRAALEDGRLFRVRHGWYARPNAPEIAVRAIRVGGRITGVSALRAMGLFLPRPAQLQLIVPANAANLRKPRTRFDRLAPVDGVKPAWVDRPRLQSDPSSWIVSADQALSHVLRHESREVSVAACDGVVRYLRWNHAMLRSAFASAPARAQQWLRLVDGRADAWGESFLRLWLLDAGIRMEPQPLVPGVGRLDGRVSAHVYVEVDGAQHGEDWDGPGGSSFENDHRRDARMAARGDRVLRFTNTQLIDDWPECLAAVRRTCADDVRLSTLASAEDRRTRQQA